MRAYLLPPFSRSGRSRSRGRPGQLGAAALRGAGAGLIGVAAMTLGEKVEQRATRRPNSYVPGRTLLTLLGQHPGPQAQPTGWNLAMHWGTGAALGALRWDWSAVGLRGPRASLAHAVVRLATDQTLENVTGAGAPPHTWPLREQVVDVGHKGVYALVTGWAADRLVPAHLESATSPTSH